MAGARNKLRLRLRRVLRRACGARCSAAVTTEKDIDYMRGFVLRLSTTVSSLRELAEHRERALHVAEGTRGAVPPLARLMQRAPSAPC